MCVYVCANLKKKNEKEEKEFSESTKASLLKDWAIMQLANRVNHSLSPSFTITFSHSLRQT